MKKKAVVRGVEKFEVPEWQFGKRCVACEDLAVWRVYRSAEHGRGIDLSSLRYSCSAHVDSVVLYPVVLREKLAPLPAVNKRQEYVGDMSGFYANVIEELGGVMPFPKKERLAGVSGRQWVKFRKHEGLAAKSR